jgi:hypothetical protein
MHLAHEACELAAMADQLIFLRERGAGAL